MMMTQSSYYGGDFDSFSRSSHRAPTAAHYDRAVPYTHTYYEPPDYPGRAGSRALIQEQGQDNQPSAHARRRIQVACSRCRRRKIKCTGDPGDGSGCSACRSAGADRNTCTFIRVGSHPVSGIDLMPASSSMAGGTPSTATYGTDVTTSAYDAGLYQTHHRPSLPMLQTRSAYPEYDTYNASPADDYTYASSSIQRQPTYTSGYGAESFRPWTSGSISAPVTSGSMYYEPGSAFSFGNLQVPAMPAGRLPSVTAEAFSPLNMGSLHSSLPTQTVQERRLPMPYTQSYAQPAHSAAEVPQIRSLGSVSDGRMVINGVHSRNSMPWSMDNTSLTPSARHGSLSGASAVQSQHGLPMPTSTGSMTEPTILGYQFSTSCTSPEVSPTSGPTLSESFSSTSTAGSIMPPPAHFRYSNHHSHRHHNTAKSPRPSSARAAAASLYSFSAGVDTTDRGTTSDRHGSTDDSVLSATPQHNYMPPLRHPQPQHTASLDELRRRSSNDERATTHRMSVSNLNARY
ncbi:hypothetical protein M409DRAFT_52484 [Zasmidium cellare ATCC 36951]|uniref:Zn(2)-C6 fungal-type domain-containing protein n=1 Tax=Zasmidium cellare ATCC 36951 TaxID=1080233 RepID=A0A6A6CTQ9_ZASCE|nr:uncharacterized protein M409DRAFT_52484 [Zasmidium cellare ATCC 36951]KAF2169212.1 hypothetical protein M409DRAFT_52484 [Zasmidium cellare ATCC 36951]